MIKIISGKALNKVRQMNKKKLTQYFRVLYPDKYVKELVGRKIAQ